MQLIKVGPSLHEKTLGEGDGGRRAVVGFKIRQIFDF